MDAKQQLAQFILTHKEMPLANAMAIADRFENASFDKGNLALKEGQQCSRYYFLVRGFMRSWTTDLEGREVTTAFHQQGSVVCELFSFFKHVPSGENIEAATNCEVLCISFQQLQEAFHALPEFREFGRSILVNAYAQLKQRMLSSLHQTAEERYKRLLHTSPDVFQYSSLKQIASYLGITDTSLSRIRAAFAKEGS